MPDPIRVTDHYGEPLAVGDTVAYLEEPMNDYTVQEIRGVGGCVVRLDIDGYPWVPPQKLWRLDRA